MQPKLPPCGVKGLANIRGAGELQAKNKPPCPHLHKSFMQRLLCTGAEYVKLDKILDDLEMVCRS